MYCKLFVARSLHSLNLRKRRLFGLFLGSLPANGPVLQDKMLRRNSLPRTGLPKALLVILVLLILRRK